MPFAQALDLGVIRRPFVSAIPAQVVGRAVAIFFAVKLVVLHIERNEIIQCKTVVARHEIDALLWLALLALVNIGACHQPVGHGVSSAIVALQE